MTHGEATVVVGMLLKFYPSHRLDDDAAELYARAWMELSKESAMQAMNTWVRREKFFPTVAELIQLATAARPERVPWRAQLPERTASLSEIRETVAAISQKLQVRIDATERALDKCSCGESGKCPVNHGGAR